MKSNECEATTYLGIFENSSADMVRSKSTNCSDIGRKRLLVYGDFAYASNDIIDGSPDLNEGVNLFGVLLISWSGKEGCELELVSIGAGAPFSASTVCTSPNSSRMWSIWRFCFFAVSIISLHRWRFELRNCSSICEHDNNANFTSFVVSFIWLMSAAASAFFPYNTTKSFSISICWIRCSNNLCKSIFITRTHNYRLQVLHKRKTEKNLCFDANIQPQSVVSTEKNIQKRAEPTWSCLQQSMCQIWARCNK